MTASHPSWDHVLAPDGGWASLVVATEASIDDFARGLPSRCRATVRIVRGRRCLAKPALFQEWAAALQFPGYFGENWDAFEECLSDRAWLPQDTLVVILAEAHRILEGQTDERATLLRILRSVAEAPGEQAFRVVFQCEAGHETATRAMLHGEGIRV
jgi:hypothetical protein